MKIQVLWLTSILMLATPGVRAEPLSIEQVLQAVIDHYPSLKAASYQVEKAHQNAIKVKSQLGWQLMGQGGVANDVSLFGGTVQRLDLGGGLHRSLKSGGDVSLGANVKREDADSVAQPNPLTSSRLDLSYRRPLQKGAGNPDYILALEQAGLSVELAEAEQRIVYDKLAEQVIDLYFSAATTLSRIRNINLSLQRTALLEKFTKSRLNLGIAENKDQLQVIAQYNSQQAQLRILETAWVQQSVSLNRLMGRVWDKELSVDAVTRLPVSSESLMDLVQQVKKHSPALIQINAQLKSAMNVIKKRQESRKDQLDLVMYIGNQTSEGSSPLGEQDSSDVVGGVRLEYQTGLDKSGFDADLYQARLDLGLLKESHRQVLEDLQYGTATLSAQIKAVQKSFSAYELSVSSEREKLADADKRYRKGRIDIDQLIQFENQLSAAELSLDLQHIELIRLMYQLDLLRGFIWRTINLPPLEFSEYLAK